jgi:hypothetical protein
MVLWKGLNKDREMIVRYWTVRLNALAGILVFALRPYLRRKLVVAGAHNKDGHSTEGAEG